MLHGPPGWLPAVEPGSLIGLKLSGSSLDAIVIRPADVAACRLAAAVGQVREFVLTERRRNPRLSGSRWMPAAELLALITTEAPEMLQRPLLPIAEIVNAAGFLVVDGWIEDSGSNRQDRR